MDSSFASTRLKKVSPPRRKMAIRPASPDICSYGYLGYGVLRVARIRFSAHLLIETLHFDSGAE
jgi:hypothetical protein